MTCVKQPRSPLNQSNEPSEEFELTANSLGAPIETHELAVSSNSSLGWFIALIYYCSEVKNFFLQLPVTVSL